MVAATKNGYDEGYGVDVIFRNLHRKKRPVKIIHGRYPSHTPAAPQPAVKAKK
jgi:hypothetical protein